MKKIFLSFNPIYFKPLLYGLKMYEYRKRFCDEETKAYLYLSGKKRMVIGVLELGKPIRLDKTRDEYLNYPETLKRVDEYIEKRDVCAVPIKSLRLFDKPILLSDLREEIKGFMPPQMYYVLDNHKELKDILERQKLKDYEFIHKHEKIYYDNLAMSVSELMMTDKYKKIDSVVDKMTDYKDIL